MLIAHISDPHIKAPGKLAYGRVDTAAMLADCVRAIGGLTPSPDLILVTGDLVDFGLAEEYAHLKRILKPLRPRLIAIPGNHDGRDVMRAAFADEGYLPAEGFLQFVIEDLPFRLVGLDTVIPGEGGGELCAERLVWLDKTLSSKPDAPTLVMMHHPPFLTGIGHMDRIGLAGRDGFADVMARHPQVRLILCGHLHRTIHAMVGGRPALTCPGPAHQVALDLQDEAPSRFRMEPPGFLLHRWRDGLFVSHAAVIGDYGDPHPFFDPAGHLID